MSETDDELPTPDDYGIGDGWDSLNGTDKCPHCGRVHSPNGGYFGPVFTADGTEYEQIYATDPADRPFFCVSCYDELTTNRKKIENSQLTDYE